MIAQIIETQWHSTYLAALCEFSALLNCELESRDLVKLDDIRFETGANSYKKAYALVVLGPKC